MEEEKLYKVDFTRTVVLMEKVIKAKNEKEAEEEAYKYLNKFDTDYEDVEVKELTDFEKDDCLEDKE